ncbi:MAG: hypothetical protein C4519_28490 [Desulfobacteraceae bacterium]|nr:MAG: hypothetical protein C4519_28490 [Desulfobacteraceae bacterium]
MMGKSRINNLISPAQVGNHFLWILMPLCCLVARICCSQGYVPYLRIIIPIRMAWVPGNNV